MSNYAAHRPKLTPAERAARDRESLTRARENPSLANYTAVIEGFAARGIPVDEIRPKENVLTFNAWRALGRFVKKGEKSLAIPVIVTRSEVDPETGDLGPVARVSATAHVFHISQTEARS